MTDETESAVYTVHLEVDPEEEGSLEIHDALNSAGFEVYAVKRADVKGLSELDEYE